MTLGLTFFKPGAPGLEPFYTLHVGWPGPTPKREKDCSPQKTSILLIKIVFFVNDFGADLLQNPGPLALGLFRPYMLGGQDPAPKGKKDCSQKKTAILLNKNAFFFGERLAGQLPSGPPHGPSMNPLWWVTWAHPAAAQARPGQQPSPADANLARPTKNHKMSP